MKEYISSDKEYMELTNSENKKYHLLIADKDKISIDNTIKVFKSEIYKFTEITKSKDLIATIKKEKPDLVILEVNLNEVDGIDVCTDLRSDVTFAKLPIIFVSNNADSKNITFQIDCQSCESGFAQMLPKRRNSKRNQEIRKLGNR